MADNVEIIASTWNRFLSRSLVIEPELIGKSTEFKYDNRKIKISIPTEAIDKLWKEVDLPSFDEEDKRLAILAWREEEVGRTPTQILVYFVDMTLEIPERLRIKSELLSRPPNASDILNQEEQSSLDNIAISNGKIAEAAFEYWLRVLRYESRNWSIGRPSVKSHRSGWGTYLFAHIERKRFWNANIPVSVPTIPEKVINSDIWSSTEKSLQDGIDSPLYFAIYFDGIEHLMLADYQRAIVDFAVACEVFMRSKLAKLIPSSLTNPLAKYILEASAFRVRTQFFPELLSPIGMRTFKGLSKDLEKLFESRNKILHSGISDGSSISLVSRFQQTTARIIGFDDHQDYWKS